MGLHQTLENDVLVRIFTGLGRRLPWCSFLSTCYVVPLSLAINKHREAALYYFVFIFFFFLNLFSCNRKRLLEYAVEGSVNIKLRSLLQAMLLLVFLTISHAVYHLHGVHLFGPYPWCSIT